MDSKSGWGLVLALGSEPQSPPLGKRKEERGRETQATEGICSTLTSRISIRANMCQLPALRDGYYGWYPHFSVEETEAESGSVPLHRAEPRT